MSRFPFFVYVERVVLFLLVISFGVRALFAALPQLRIAVQVAGALYLTYVAIRLWRSGGQKAEGSSETQNGFAAFRMGFLTNIMNPKSALFFRRCIFDGHACDARNIVDDHRSDRGLYQRALLAYFFWRLHSLDRAFASAMQIIEQCLIVAAV